MDLKMEVTQTLGLSQRMIQSTEILQMSAQELDNLSQRTGGGESGC